MERIIVFAAAAVVGAATVPFCMHTARANPTLSAYDNYNIIDFSGSYYAASTYPWVGDYYGYPGLSGTYPQADPSGNISGDYEIANYSSKESTWITVYGWDIYGTNEWSNGVSVYVDPP